MRILYLEDDPIDAEALRRALLRLRPELHLTIAASPSAARAALHAATADDFDVVVIDISLPEMNGFEFLDDIDRAGLRGERRVVVFTSSGHRLDVLAAERTRVDDYVMKTADPVCFEELVRALDAPTLRAAGACRRPPQRRQVLKPNSA